jgi:ankyrin repeat protein
MKLRYYPLSIVLMLTTLFSSCKQSLNMQKEHEEKELKISNIDYSHNTELLFEAVKTGNKELLEESLLNADVNAKNKQGSTLLDWAASNSNTEIVELLINRNADVNAKDNHGCTPLHRAVSKSNTEIVELLINRNADVNAKDNQGSTPLHMAATGKGNTEIVELLTNRNADVNAKNNQGSTPLHWAVSNSNTEIVDWLTNRNADVNAKDNQGCTPLHMAAGKHSTEILELLTNRNADVNAKNNQGSTPLHWAASNSYRAAFKGHKNVVELLIKSGGDLNVKDNDGSTPLHWAAERYNIDFFNLIKDIVLDNNQHFMLNKGNKLNKLCCLKHFLEEKNIVSNILYERNLIRAIIKLSELSVDLSIKNAYNKTALDIAKKKMNVAIIEILEELEKVAKNDQMIPFKDYMVSKKKN